MCHECNALYCLPQSHLVSQDPIDALVIEIGQPIHAFELIHLEKPTEDGRLGDLPVRLQHGCGQTEVLVDWIYIQAVTYLVSSNLPMYRTHMTLEGHSQ